MHKDAEALFVVFLLLYMFFMAADQAVGGMFLVCLFGCMLPFT